MSDLVLCPAVQVYMCGQLDTRLGLVYETSLGLGLETTRFVHSAGVGIVWLVSFPEHELYIALFLASFPDQKSNLGMIQHCAAWDTTISMSLTGGSPTTTSTVG